MSVQSLNFSIGSPLCLCTKHICWPTLDYHLLSCVLICQPVWGHLFCARPHVGFWEYNDALDRLNLLLTELIWLVAEIVKSIITVKCDKF